MRTSLILQEETTVRLYGSLLIHIVHCTNPQIVNYPQSKELIQYLKDYNLRSKFYATNMEMGN